MSITIAAQGNFLVDHHFADLKMLLFFKSEFLRSRWSRQIALSETETFRAQDRDRDQDFQARDRDRDQQKLVSRQDQVSRPPSLVYALSTISSLHRCQ